MSLTPSYSGALGKLWLERGGVYVVANIRGGGEFGPDWHQAALKRDRQRAFDDFVAVAEDLIRRGITSPRRLGIMGGSNGGLSSRQPEPVGRHGGSRRSAPSARSGGDFGGEAPVALQGDLRPDLDPAVLAGLRRRVAPPACRC